MRSSLYSKVGGRYSEAMVTTSQLSVGLLTSRGLELRVGKINMQSISHR